MAPTNTMNKKMMNKSEGNTNGKKPKNRRHRNRRNRKSKQQKQEEQDKVEDQPVDSMEMCTEEVQELPQAKVLKKIRDEINKVEDMVRLRIPRMHERVLSKVYGWKWLVKTIRKGTDQRRALKDVIISLGTHQYQAASQAEQLTRQLLELDNVESNGNEGIRRQRKDQVIRIQSLLEEVDKVTSIAMKLKTHGISVVQAMIDQMNEEFDHSNGESASEPESESGVDESSGEDSTKSDDEDMDDESDTDMKVDQSGSLDPQEALKELEKAQRSQPVREPKVEVQPKKETAQQVKRVTPGYNKLPVWEPQTKVTQSDTGFSLLIAIPGVNEDDVSVTLSPDGLMTVKGQKLPSQSDIHQYSRFGTQDFGRFNIQRRFDPSEIDVDRATMEMQHNGVMRINVPFARMQRRSMPQQIRRGPVGGYRNPRQAQYASYNPMSGSYPPRNQGYNPFGFF